MMQTDHTVMSIQATKEIPQATKEVPYKMNFYCPCITVFFVDAYV